MNDIEIFERTRRRGDSFRREILFLKERMKEPNLSKEGLESCQRLLDDFSKCLAQIEKEEKSK